MPLIDKAIEYIAPQWAVRRAEARMRLQASYQGGMPTRLSERWPVAGVARYGSSVDRAAIQGARDRGYNAFQNNPVARTLINTETDNVIGDGLNFQPTTDDEAWNREAKDRYYQWLDQCSVRGGDYHTGCEVQRLLWSRSRVAGDIGWVLTARGPDSFIQIVPSENICTPDGKSSVQGIYDGVKFDAFGKPVEFYVLSQDANTGKRDFVTVPAKDFVFLPHTTDPWQARGESCYVTIFDLLSHLDRYVDGVSLAAWMATVFGIVFKQSNGPKQLAGLGTLANSQGIQQKAVTLENGSVKYIGTDEEVAQVQATQPMQQTPEFIRAMYRMLGQPFDMPLEVIAKDMSTCTFASARIGLLPFYRSCRIKAARFSSRWSRTINWWLSRERNRADGDPKKWVTPFPDRFWSHELLVNAWDYTDPVSEAQADLLQMDMGTKSLQMVCEERGRDFSQIQTQRESEGRDADPVHSTMTRDSIDPVQQQQEDPEIARLKARADAYGVAVRAGSLTPQMADEEQMRNEAGFPPMGDEARKAWTDDKGVRRPITLAQNGQHPLATSQPNDPTQQDQSNA